MAVVNSNVSGGAAQTVTVSIEATGSRVAFDVYYADPAGEIKMATIESSSANIETALGGAVLVRSQTGVITIAQIQSGTCDVVQMSSSGSIIQDFAFIAVYSDAEIKISGRG